MIAAFFAAGAVAIAQPLTDRIRDSAAAAQAHQGPFDGAWELKKGVQTVWLELADPPSQPDRATGAWRDGEGRMGSARLERRSGRLLLSLDGRRIAFERDRRGVWRSRAGGSLARPGPPV